MILTAVGERSRLRCFILGGENGADGIGSLWRAGGESSRSPVVRPLRGAAILSNPSRAEGVVFSNGCVVASHTTKAQITYFWSLRAVYGS